MPRTTRTPAAEPSTSVVDEPSARLISIADAARHTGLSYWAVRDLILAGHLKSVRLPSPAKAGANLRRILIDRCDLDQLITDSKG